MSKLKPGHAAAFALAAAMAVGCSASDQTAPVSPATPALSAILGDMSMASLGNLTASFTQIDPNRVPGAPTLYSPACAYSPTTQSFSCPTITSGGVTYNRSFTLFDAGGHAQSALDANTASIHAITTMNGILPTGIEVTPTTIDRRDDMTLSGLTTSAPTLNGTSTSVMTTTLATTGESDMIATTFADTTTGLVLPAVGSALILPRSGSVAMTVTTTMTFVPPVFLPDTTSFREVMTFDGSTTVTITLTGPGSQLATCKQTVGSLNPPACS